MSLRQKRLTALGAIRLLSGAVSDAFNRADSTTTMGSTDTGQAWVTSGTWGISSNQAYQPSSTDGGVVLCEAGQTDVKVQATLVNGNGGVIARAADSSNYYLINCKPTGQTCTFYKCVSGSFTSLQTFTGVNAGSVVSIQCVGTAITVVVDGTTKVSTTDSSISTGTKAGFRHNDVAGNLYDDFSAVHAP